MALIMAEDKYYDLVAQIQELKVEIMAISDTSMSFTEARKSIFFGKSVEWIDFWIVEKHPEVLTNNNSKTGFMTPKLGKGHPRYITSVNLAKIWIFKNRSKIDWTAPEPKTFRKNLAA